MTHEMPVFEESKEALRTRALMLKDGRRTSARLEAPLWQAYDGVCKETGISRNALSQMIDTRRSGAVGMTNALRVFLLSYFRSAAGRDARKQADDPLLHLVAALDMVGPSGVGTGGWVSRVSDVLPSERWLGLAQSGVGD